MVNQQDYLYEGYIDTEVVPEEDQNGSYLNADIPNRQFTQITEEGTLGDREEMEKEATDNLMRQTFGDGRLEQTDPSKRTVRIRSPPVVNKQEFIKPGNDPARQYATAIRQRLEEPFADVVQSMSLMNSVPQV